MVKLNVCQSQRRSSRIMQFRRTLTVEQEVGGSSPPNCTSSQTDVVPIDAEASAAVSQQAASNCSTLLASPPPFTHNSPINGLGEGKSCLLSDLRISNSV